MSSQSGPDRSTLPSLETRTRQFELSIALSLAFWPALSLAVSNNWGGEASTDKRDWFAGAIAELFESRPDTDLEDVETVLLQVMLDEFEVNVDDDSAFEVAEQILRFRDSCGKGDFTEVEALRRRFGARGAEKKINIDGLVQEADQDTDGDSVDDETDSDDGDVNMNDAPPVAPRQRVAPEIDEDGFTKVVGKKKR